MRILRFIICLCVSPVLLNAQTITEKLRKASQRLEADSQMRNASYSLFVIDSKTGKTVFEKNAQMGLAPASTQKILTSGAAFEMLGSNFRYKTDFGYTGKIQDTILNGRLFIKGSGDPTLGSWRYSGTKSGLIMDQLRKALDQRGIRKITGGMFIDESVFDLQPLPGGWIWDDIGNYYGAGAWALNWKENQYDLYLSSGDAIGNPVEIIGSSVDLSDFNLINELVSAEKGSGDNAYIYLPPFINLGFLKGTIPIGEKKFTISGSMPYPSKFFAKEIGSFVGKGMENCPVGSTIIDKINKTRTDTREPKILFTVVSPPLDSINFWFLRRSINLYGEALARTIAAEKTGIGSTDKGAELIRNFWATKGIRKEEINIVDGCGLSPQNRITTRSLVRALQFAGTRPWFNSFYISLPTYNGMKMKSGSIGGARSFAGYHSSRKGNEFTFAIIVNNFDGSASTVVNKIYSLLNELKEE